MLLCMFTLQGSLHNTAAVVCEGPQTDFSSVIYLLIEAYFQSEVCILFVVPFFSLFVQHVQHKEDVTTTLVSI